MAAETKHELSELLSSLLSSPELIGKLLSALGGIGLSAGSEEATEVTAEPNGATEEDDGKAVSLPASTGGGGSDGRREKLLRALRPYLSEGRCRRLDSLMRISPMLHYLHKI